MRRPLAGVLLAVADKPLAPGELSSGEQARYRTLPGEHRRRTWLTGRRALRQALAGCGLPTDTSLYRFPGPHASLSHSAGTGAVAAAVNGPAIAGIGVDIEDDRAPEPETAGLFLTCTERSQLTAVAPEQGPPTLQRLWTVKEALFKADPDNSTGVLRRYSVTSATARHGPAVRHRTASPAAPAFHYLSLALPRGFISVAVALLPHWRMQTMHAVDFGRMAERISSLASVPVTRLTPGTVITDLIPDSFTFIEITVDLQEEYDVVLDGNDLEGLRTLGDLAELLQDRQRGH